jgi:hypothetical protein
MADDSRIMAPNNRDYSTIIQVAPHLLPELFAIKRHRSCHRLRTTCHIISIRFLLIISSPPTIKLVWVPFCRRDLQG